MTQISTGGPYIAIEEHERRMEALRQDTIIKMKTWYGDEIKSLMQRIEKLEGEVAELEARRNIRKEFVPDGTPFHPMGIDKQYVCHNGATIEWSDEKQAFFKPWIDLGVFDKIPVDPGIGYEFLPHGSPPEEGDEYWYIGSGTDPSSGWEKSIEKPENHRVHSSPDGLTGPYRRKIKPFKTVPSGTIQVVLADPKTFLVDSEQAYPLPKHPACGSDPFWTTHNGLHRIGCSLCPDFGTSPTKSIKQVVEWWTKMCAPVAGESLTTNPESAQGCDLASPATPTAAAGAGSPVTGNTVPPEVGKRYLCRNGEVTEPMERRCGGTYPFMAKVGPKSVQRTWTEEGRHDIYMKGPRPYDLVAEYVEPSQSPDDWVTLTDPEHVLRKCDQCRCLSTKYNWTECRDLAGQRIGELKGTDWEFCCRRKDLPVVPYDPNAERKRKASEKPCARCGKPIGNPVFTVCDECWPLTGAAADKPRMRQVTLREYTINNEIIWTSASWIEGTGRRAVVEVPE